MMKEKKIYIINGKKIECTLIEHYEKDHAYDAEFFDFGTLNQIKDLYIFTSGKVKGKIKPMWNVKNPPFGEIEVEKNDERTFTEIGVRMNFYFIVN